MSTTDWDFLSTYWELSPDYFTSAPTSLHQRTGYGGAAFLSKHPNTTNIVQGRLAVKVLRTANDIFHLLFRNQTPAGTPYTSAGTWYDVAFGPAPSLRHITNGLTDWAQGFTCPLHLNAWDRVRVTWYNGYNPSNEACLIIIVEYWAGTKWAAALTYYDTNDFSAGSTVNRVGMDLNAATVYTDDIEIWRG